MKSLHLPLIVLSFAGLSSAQKLPLDDGSGRVLQLVNVEDLLYEIPEQASANAQLQQLAEFLRQQVEPPLGKHHDIQPLGRHSLALLLQTAQAAWVDRALTAARASKGTIILVETTICSVPAAVFTKLVAPHLRQDDASAKTRTTLLPTATAEEIRTELNGQGDILMVPRVAVRPLASATMQTGDEVSYVKDFDVQKVGDKWVADPVVDTVFNGTRIRVIAALLDNGEIGVHYDLLAQTVVQPIPTFVTTLGVSEPISIQLPRVHGQHIRQVLALREDATALMAAQTADEKYIMALVKVRATKSDGAAQAPRAIR